ncbi:MAG: BrnT family toxin [Alphaproteobacteria bacterium]|nr:BrnT family toxin [Alphaproteobacteria bacterium]
MFEWDTARAADNLATHGVDFVRAARMFDNPVLEREDTRQFWGERRFIAIGHADGMYLVVVWAPRGARKRILSAWRADRADETFYRAAIPQPAGPSAGPQPGRRALPGQSRGGLLEIGRARLSLPKPPSRASSSRS